VNHDRRDRCRKKLARDRAHLRDVRHLVQQNHELVAPEPRQHVTVAQALFELGPDPLEQNVAGGVAECVVDELETIQIDEHDTKLAIVALRNRDGSVASKPRGPPASVVLTDWLSITPAVGLASRPSASRASMTR
jgi:hypothetical protein